MKNNDRTPLTPIEVCTLMAHEAVSMLDTTPEALPSAFKFRTALELFSSVKGLGDDGRALLAWVDAEIDSAKRFTADGTDAPRAIASDRLLLVPDAAAQMDAAWMLFDAATEMRTPRTFGILLDAAHMLTEMGGLRELVETAKPPANALDSATLQRELEDIHAAFQSGLERAAPQEEPSL